MYISSQTKISKAESLLCCSVKTIRALYNGAWRSNVSGKNSLQWSFKEALLQCVGIPHRTPTLGQLKHYAEQGRQRHVLINFHFLLVCADTTAAIHTSPTPRESYVMGMLFSFVAMKFQVVAMSHILKHNTFQTDRSVSALYQINRSPGCSVFFFSFLFKILILANFPLTHLYSLRKI